MDFVDNYAGKAVGIQKFIGRRPILAFGNSDGDQQMLEWTAAGKGVRFMPLVHHDDVEREWAYDRKSNVGQFDKAWDEAITKGWIVVSMKADWATIFPVKRKHRPRQTVWPQSAVRCHLFGGMRTIPRFGSLQGRDAFPRGRLSSYEAHSTTLLLTIETGEDGRIHRVLVSDIS
jgi:hypothetical protein